jgi:hypothetical protein
MYRNNVTNLMHFLLLASCKLWADQSAHNLQPNNS